MEVIILEDKKYCKHCGELIDKDCVICPKCGKQVESLGGGKDQPIIINNSASNSASSSASSSASAAASASTGKTRVKKRYSLLLDLFLIFITCGLWIFWMIFRPKYEYV